MKFVKSVSLSDTSIRIIQKEMEDLNTQNFSRAINSIIVKYVRFKNIAMDLQDKKK